MRVLVPVGVGELIDKIAILDLKIRKMRDAEKLRNVSRERGALLRVWRECLVAWNGKVGSGCAPVSEVEALVSELTQINERLWNVEDDLRACEASQDFSSTFVALARSVYQLNDRRAAVKKSINRLFGSLIVEEKSYVEVARGVPLS